MHDPLVVAHEIRRPWPQRSGRHDRGETRWSIRRRATPERVAGEASARRGAPFPWWKPGSYSRFWVLAGRWWWWPPLITIWHREPGGRDAGSVCCHWRDGRPTEAWRWHVHHWHIQIHPTQAFKRFVWSRCAGCRRRFPYRYEPASSAWDGTGPRWFRGERDVYHQECLSLSQLRHQHDADTALIRLLVGDLLAGDDLDGWLLRRFGARGDRGWLDSYTQRRRIETAFAPPGQTVAL